MQVTIGQVWEDKDRRRTNRKFRVERIINGKAVCRVINAGASKGKSPVRIRLDRFVPKYYQKITPANNVVQSLNGVSTDSSFATRCSEVLGDNWVTPFAGYAVLKDGPLTIMVREISRDISYDVKIRINSYMISSFVDYNILEHTFGKIKAQLKLIKHCIDDVLDD